MSQEFYCGINKVPKNKKRGTMKECLDSRQVRYFGLNKVDQRLLEQKRQKVVKKTAKQIKLESVKLRGRVSGLKKKLNNKELSVKEKKQINLELNKAENELKLVSMELKLLQGESKPQSFKEAIGKEVKLQPKPKKKINLKKLENDLYELELEVDELEDKQEQEELDIIDEDRLDSLKNILIPELEEKIRKLKGGCYSCGAGKGEMHHAHCTCHNCMCKGKGKAKKKKGGQVNGQEAINMGTFKYGGKFKQLQNPFNEVPYEQIPYPYARESIPYKWGYFV